jgi:hypothetical protein
VPARKYTEAEFTEAVRTSTTIAALLKAVGLRPVGGKTASAKRTIQRLGGFPVSPATPALIQASPIEATLPDR